MISAPAVSRGDILNSAPRFMVGGCPGEDICFNAISWESMEVNGISNNKSRKNALFSYLISYLNLINPVNLTHLHLFVLFPLKMVLSDGIS